MNKRHNSTPLRSSEFRKCFRRSLKQIINSLHTTHCDYNENDLKVTVGDLDLDADLFNRRSPTCNSAFAVFLFNFTLNFITSGRDQRLLLRFVLFLRSRSTTSGTNHGASSSSDLDPLFHLSIVLAVFRK